MFCKRKWNGKGLRIDKFWCLIFDTNIYYPSQKIYFKKRFLLSHCVVMYSCLVRCLSISLFVYLHVYNPWQNIWNKIEKYSETGQDKESLISTFTCFWLLEPKFNFWKGDWETVWAHVSTKIGSFPNSSVFPMILSLRLFGNSWGNSYTKFDIPDITFRFTNG